LHDESVAVIGIESAFLCESFLEALNRHVRRSSNDDRKLLLGIRSVDSGEKRILSLERFRSSLNIVEAQIQAELPISQGTSVDAGDADANAVFKGDSASMQFPSNFSVWGNLRGYVKVTYRVRQNESGKQDLYVAESTTGTADRGEVKLFEYFDGIYFDYFQKKLGEGEGDWVKEWPSTDSTDLVPEKVRLHLINGGTDMAFIIPVRVRDVVKKTPPVAEATQ
jgi:hypothetical protein